MDQYQDKDDFHIVKNLKLFFDEEKNSRNIHKNAYHSLLASKSYIHDVVVSLICHQKLSRSSSDKFWVYEDFVYHNLFDFINNDFFLNKIAEIREYFSILGSQFLTFDPLFQNIIFLPLSQQKIIYESAIIQSIQNSESKNSLLLDKDGNFSLEQFRFHQNYFHSALVLVLVKKLELTITLLNYVAKRSRGNLFSLVSLH